MKIINKNVLITILIIVMCISIFVFYSRFLIDYGRDMQCFELNGIISDGGDCIDKTLHP